MGCCFFSSRSCSCRSCLLLFLPLPLPKRMPWTTLPPPQHRPFAGHRPLDSPSAVVVPERHYRKNFNAELLVKDTERKCRRKKGVKKMGKLLFESRKYLIKFYLINKIYKTKIKKENFHKNNWWLDKAWACL